MTEPLLYTLVMVRKALFLLLFLTASTAHAQSDSVTVGLSVVEGFYTDMTSIVRTFEDVAEVEEFAKKSLDRTNEVAAEIRAMRWTDVPGQRRFNRVYNVFEEYTSEQISSVKEFFAGLPPEEQARVAKAVDKLMKSREEKLERLNESLKLETYKKKGPKPVPIMEKTPHEKEREEGEGIYFR